MAFRIELLGDQSRAAFSCGATGPDHYLKVVAGQDMRRGLATCFVAVDPDADVVAGFYTLSATSIEATEYPEKKNVGRYNRIPAALLGRLAVSATYQGIGLGQALLYDAIRKLIDSNLAAAVMVVDAKDDAAAKFYERHGFISFGKGHSKFYMPLKDIKRLFAQAT